ncbi:MAG: hypothetical protein ABEK59_07575 [Halobacteria archaeon]
MSLEDYVEELEPDTDRERRKLAEEKSYRILDHLDGFEDRFNEVKQGDSLFGSTSPSVFVGRSSYPRVPVGLLNPVGEEENPAEYTTSGDWYHDGMNIEGVLQYRTGLLNSRRRTDVDLSDSTNLLDVQKEVGMATDPVDVEVRLRDEPDLDLDMDQVTAPTGPNATARDADLAENPYVPREIEKTFEDTDWKSRGAVEYLYEKGFDVYQINDVLSVGALGRGEDRKLVPTRWSITAVDDMLGKYLRGEVKGNTSVDKTRVYMNEYMGNRYWVVFTPGRWEFELVEMKSPGSVWNPNPDDEIWMGSAREGYEGRTGYVDETAGAYYCSRLGVLEQLRSIGRSGKCLVLREVSDDYWAPVGVWQVREAVRNAGENSYVEYETFGDAVRDVVDYLPVSLPDLRRKSTMVSGLQTSLSRFG